MSTSGDTSILTAKFISDFDPTIQRLVGDNAPQIEFDMTKPWVRFSVKPNASKRPSLGTGRNEAFGLVYLQIFTPLQSGPATAYAIADEFIAIFRNWRSDTGDLWVDQETIRNVPSKDWYQVNVFLSYTSNT